VPVGEKCGAASWALSWSGFHRQATIASGHINEC
jgi:hypothetical protein